MQKKNEQGNGIITEGTKERKKCILPIKDQRGKSTNGRNVNGSACIRTTKNVMVTVPIVSIKNR